MNSSVPESSNPVFFQGSRIAEKPQLWWTPCGCFMYHFLESCFMCYWPTAATSNFCGWCHAYTHTQHMGVEGHFIPYTLSLERKRPYTVPESFRAQRSLSEKKTDLKRALSKDERSLQATSDRIDHIKHHMLYRHHCNIRHIPCS